jgi:hypothetical protein
MPTCLGSRAVCLHRFLITGDDCNVEKKNFDRNNQKRKIVQLHERDPVLKSLDIEQLITMISPKEIEKAQVVLKEYLEGFKHLDPEKKIVLAYLFGELQGLDDYYSDNAKQSISDRLKDIYQSGFNWGYVLASLHYPQGGKNDAE